MSSRHTHRHTVPREKTAQPEQDVFVTKHVTHNSQLTHCTAHNTDPQSSGEVPVRLNQMRMRIRGECCHPLSGILGVRAELFFLFSHHSSHLTLDSDLRDTPPCSNNDIETLATANTLNSLEIHRRNSSTRHLSLKTHDFPFLESWEEVRLRI